LSSGTCCVCQLAARSAESCRMRKDIKVEPPCRSFPEVGFLICGAFAEWVRHSSVCGSVGYPFEHADSEKVAWPANFSCGKRPKTVGPASLTDDLVLPPPGRAEIRLRWGNLFAPLPPNGHRVGKSLRVAQKIFRSRPQGSRVPDQPVISRCPALAGSPPCSTATLP